MVVFLVEVFVATMGAVLSRRVLIRGDTINLTEGVGDNTALTCSTSIAEVTEGEGDKIGLTKVVGSKTTLT